MARSFPTRSVARLLRRITLPLSQQIVKHAMGGHRLLRQRVLLYLGSAYFKLDEILRKYSLANKKFVMGTIRKKEALGEVRGIGLGSIAFLILIAALYIEIAKAFESSSSQDKTEVEKLGVVRDQLMDLVKKQSEDIRTVKKRVAEYSQKVDFPLPRNFVTEDKIEEKTR